jgi:hypothetical protein
MRLVVCIIALCGSFFITLWLISPEAPQRLEDQRISHYNDLPPGTLARNLEQQRHYIIDEILAQRQPTQTPKDSEAREGEGAAKKHHPDKGGSTQQMNALLRKMDALLRKM